MKGTLYALTRNKNDIDSKEKLDSMLQKVDATGAAFINGKNILADSIFARQISAEAITTEHMAANTIKGDRIEVGTLNGDRITANTITSNMIHTSGLDAGVIKTGTISAGNGVSVINMANGEFSLGGGKIGYVASTNKLYIGAGALFLGELPIEEHNRMVGNRDSALTKKTTLTNEKAQWDASYTGVYGNVNLTGTPKTNLYGKYTAYGTAYTNVINALNAVINAPTNTSITDFATLQGTADTMMSNYRTALSELTTALTAANQAVADKLAANALVSAQNYADEGTLYLRGTGYNRSGNQILKLNGNTIYSTGNTGMRATVINRSTLAVVSDTIYGVYNNDANQTIMATALNALTDTVIVAITSYDAIGINANLKAALARCGGSGTYFGGSYHRVPYALVGIPGIGKGNGIEVFTGLLATDPYAEISTIITDGVPQGINLRTSTNSTVTYTSTPTHPYKVGDVWKDGVTVRVCITDSTGTYSLAHWPLVGDVTANGTSADSLKLGGTVATTVITGAANGTTANNAVTANKSTWDRANSFDASGNLATTKLTGTVSDTQIASATAWNTAKTLVSDITTDGTLTPFEKQTLKPEYDAILKEKIEAVTLATNYMVTGQSYYTNYIQAYDALYAGMNTIMTTGIASNSMITRSTMNGWFTNYYEKAAIFQRNINETARTIASGAATSAATANELAKAMTSGKSLYKDNVFAAGLNGLTVYNNSANSNVTVTRITNPADTPTTSTHAVEIKNIGTASPGIGGFYQGLVGRANAKFVIRYIAKIPVGYTIATASNAMGTGFTDTFLTAIAGTGKYEEYIRVVQCGPSGEFSTGGHVYLNGAAGSAATPVVWYVARIDTYDVTDYESFASHINADPNTVRISGSKLHFTDQVLMDNAWIDKLVANSIVTNKIQATDIAAGRITSGSISADRIAANSLSGDKITANTIDATRLKIGSGAQGGYINNPRFTSWSGAYPDGTGLWTDGGISKVTVDTVPMAQFAPAAGAQQGMVLNSSYFANGIDLDGMQYFALECRFRLTSGTNPAGASLLVDIYRQDNSYERMQLDMKEVGATVTTNTWYVARKVFKLTDANVAKTFKSISGYLLANFSGAGDAAKTIQFASVNMFQASAQEFLAQSWTNGGTTSINGGFIATGTLSADKITTGALNASLITTGALNASLITTGNLDAARITAGVISAGNGKSTINMSTGAFNFGSGKIAYDGTTLLLNVDSLKITNSSVATEVYASLAAGTAKTEAISAAATDTTSKVNSIEIGGRNLVPETNKGKTRWGWNAGSGNYSLEGITSLGINAVKAICTTKSTSWEVLYRTLDLTLFSPNTEYTISFDLYPSKSGSVSIMIAKNVGTNVLASFGNQSYTANTWNKIVKKAVTTSAPISYQYIYLTGLCGVDGSSVIIANLKIEKGNKATDWTPAPEDVTAQIETKSKTFTSTPTNYAIGDIWKDAATIKIATTASAAHNAAHWTLVGDVTSANTANDVSYVNGTSASTVKTQAAAGNTAQNTLTTKSGAWDTASTDASAAKTAIADMSSDSKVTPVEKVQLKKEWATVEAERTSLDGMAATFSITTERTNMTNAYNALNNVLNSTTGTTNGVTNGILSNMTSTTTLSGANFRAIFDDYYDKKAILQRKAAEEAKQQAVTHANTQVNGIEIGGRNTFKKTTAIAAIAGTNTTTKNSLNGMSIVSTVAGIARMSNVINENGFWTFSAWVTSTAPSTLAIDFCDMPTQNFAVSTTRTKITMTSNVTNYTSAIYHFIDIAGLIAATYTFEDVKVEKGNKATSWTPAPEDVAYDIEQKADSAEVAGNLNIVSTAAAQAKSIADAKLNKNTYDDFVKEYGEYKTALAADQSVAAGNLQAAQTAVASIKKEMGDMKESWMFNNGTKIEATPNGMLISDGNPSGMNMLLSQNRLSFFDGGVEVAYIADKTMKINNGIFVKSARIGSHLISTSPANSDITIVSFVGEG